LPFIKQYIHLIQLPFDVLANEFFQMILHSPNEGYFPKIIALIIQNEDLSLDYVRLYEEFKEVDTFYHQLEPKGHIK